MKTISKIDLRLFEILKDILNRDLKKGCIINPMGSRYIEFIRPLAETSFEFSVSGITGVNNDEYLAYFDGEEKILGQYPTTNDVLKFIPFKNISKFNLSEDYIYIQVRKNKEFIDYRLYLKDIQDYTDEEKKGLIKLLEASK